ncbi:MAG: non-canonical purine NTP pyrophosphatase [Nitrospinae bacterium]|nr:non-canonical purine NTP pyrophosphatase [Nitrospinota bacterium]
MRRVILATRNEGKRAEFDRAFADAGILFLTLSEAGFAGEIDEHGATYAENAMIKARTVARAVGAPAVADDSGIEIDALPGELGVATARYGRGRSASAVNEEILARLAGLPPQRRGCRYVAALAWVDPAGEERLFAGVCEGMIHLRQAGEAGFGFDPIFFLPERGVTMAQIPMELKNAISHRAQAMAGLKGWLTK